MTIEEKESEIIEEFEIFEDWVDKYEHLIDLGKSLEPLEPKWKTDDYLIRGCQSKVWLHASMSNAGKVMYIADSEAIITKGIIGLLVRVLSGNTPEEILNAKMQFIDRIGLKEHLSPTRSNGLVSMIKQMKAYALAYTAKTN